MKLTLLGFIEVARAAGIRISVSESLDAVRALETIGVADRGALRDALGLVLAKSREEKALFESCFELYFGRDRAGDPFAPPDVPPESQPHANGSPQAATSLASMLRANDRAGLAMALEAAANSVGAAGIRFPTQANMFVQQIMQALGLDDLTREIARLRDAGDDQGADELERGRDALRARARLLAERYLALSSAAESRWRDENAKSTTLWRLDRKQVERMRVVVRMMAKQLATKYGRDRHRSRRGRLDVRRTLRRNTPYDGVPFVTVWKRRAIEKPSVLALCDVSGSVAPVAQFLLLFLHSLNDALSDIRSFAFSSHLIDVTEILEREPIETAIATIVQELGFRSTDYGRSLEDFANGWLDRIGNRTSVIVMGDARSNNTNPRADLMKTIYERAKRVIWLNPESRWSWGSGDSEMLRYRPYCHVVRECSTLRDLEWTVRDLLTRGR
ncbi:MAG: VWA domain-containing protein [Candidatus Elarobacter sp.]